MQHPRESFGNEVKSGHGSRASGGTNAGVPLQMHKTETFGKVTEQTTEKQSKETNELPEHGRDSGAASNGNDNGPAFRGSIANQNNQDKAHSP